ncbi:hypothetical protein B0T17DRAFT_639034 [Bombardia bombarda]|uniref:SnoaL-like domain-containing protein n=1 Tax=Bombardia bombarda TaxID=252184 RepID=A0AA39X0B5_9PEZI|nr:hypothetical protein B0T17DRAFT_639034 [Bombardia bombarda]
MASSQEPTTNHLQTLYTAYRHTPSIPTKGALFFSPSCMQICRPQPAYAAADRATIVRYLHEAAASGQGLATSATAQADDPATFGAVPKRSFCTIRPLTESEFEFGTDDGVVNGAGFGTVKELEERARREGWEGMRVDLWDEVQYWWRKEVDGDGEEEKWMQILHDIMYIGPRDGTEGTEGVFIKG